MKKEVPLNPKWVEENFKDQRVFWKSLHSSGTEGTRFIPVPAGNDRPDQIPPVPPSIQDKLPKMMYRQTAGEKSCMVSSLCSALHWLGLEDQAKLVYDDGIQFISDPDQPKKLRDLMEKYLSPLQARKLTVLHDILNPTQWHIYPKMVTLVTSEGGCGHAVTICGGLLFDSNAPTAIPLTKEMLDWSCIDGYAGIRCGYEFRENGNKRRRKLLVKKAYEESLIHEPVP